MTNADYIRSLDDESLAAFLVSHIADPCAYCEFANGLIGCSLGNPCVTELAQLSLMGWLARERDPEGRGVEA